MQVYGVMQAIQQGIRELCRLLELRWFSNRECVSYIGVWNDVGFQSGTHELRIANYVGRWNYVGNPVGNSRIMQVARVVQVFQQGMRELCRLFGTMWAYSRELANYVCFWNYIVFPEWNSRMMQVFGVMQVFKQGIRELCRFFWNYAGFKQGMQVLGIMQVSSRDLKNYVCCWTYVGFPVGNS